MLKLLKPASPEDLFVERYDLLLGWALTLTNHNQPQAEDLVHDAFIQFTHRRGDLAPIENADAYLHRMLRNMYLSEVRRAGVIQDSRFSIADFDSAEMGLRTFRANDPSDHLDLQDQLRQICQYACARKQTSKAGSVLILRFFHGYYPSEIAQVLRTSRMAVDRWLQISRREAKAYLNDPTSLKFMSEGRAPSPSVSGYARPTTELLSELRETIFGSRANDCLSPAQLKERYRGPATIEAARLSHVVSCPSCLDTVNRLLGLPLLAERSSDERLARDVPPDKSGGSGAGGSGTSIMESKKKYQRREKEVMEHRPQELRIAVNGFVVGSQQVSSELSKLALTVNVDEPIGFIEVFSEQAVRLLFFDVDQPTDGRIEQSTGVDFDCGRSLDLSLNFRGPWPALNVSYLDPTFEAVTSAAEFDPETSPEASLDHRKAEVVRAQTLLAKPLAQTRSLLRSFDWRMFLRPGFVTVLVSVVLITAVVLIYRHVPTAPITARDLLQRASSSEELIASQREQVLHRTISFEEKKMTGELIARRRIEVWQGGEKGITARRLYDEGGKLIAGDWRRSDGVQTLYHHGSQPKLQPAPAQRNAAIITFESAWQMEPSAKEFSRLINSGSAHVEERGNVYVISAESVKSADSSSNSMVEKATLVLNRNDLHAIEQTLVVRQGNEHREFRFVETSFKQRPTNAVNPAVFEPEPELISSATPDLVLPSPGPQPLTPMLATATLETEVEVFKLLDAINALSGEQIGVTRDNGQLKVSGVVDSAQRKAEIAKALAPVKTGRGVVVEIETAEEVANRKRAGNSTQIQPIEKFDIATDQSLPVETELRSLLSRRGAAPDRMADEMRAFSNTVTASSRVLRRNALALKQIAERFTNEEIERLEPAKRDEWKALVRSRGRAVAGDIRALTTQLSALFPGSNVGAGSAADLKNAEDAATAAQRLFGLAAAADSQVSQSFAISSGARGDAPVRSVQFWRSLAQMAALAAELQKF